VGVGICAVLAVMFVIGDYVFDVATAVRRPVLFTTYWLIIMALVAWLCYLAVRDIAHTRRMLAIWKAEHAAERSRMLRETDKPEAHA